LGAFLVAGEDGDGAFAVHDFGQLGHDLLAAFFIVNAIGREAFALGRVGIEGDHRHAVVDGFVDGIREFVGVEQLTARPSAPASTSCSMASACFCGSSSLGVRQSILMVTPFFAPSSLAASSAPTRAAWKTGLLWDLATRPKV